MTMHGIFCLFGAALALFALVILTAQVTSGYFDNDDDADDAEIFPLER